MSQVQTAAAMDRLPWLPDDPAPLQPLLKQSGKREFVAWAIVAVLLVAAVSYWMGSRSWRQPAQREAVPVTVPLPRIAEPPQPEQPQVTLKPAPEVSPAPVREVPIARPRVDKRWAARRSGSRLKRESPPTAMIERIVADQEGISHPAKTAPQVARPAANPDAKPLTAWPASQSHGAKGRIIRIGAFGSREQAKLGWRRMVAAYPALVRLRATVVSDRNSRGRYFYRFQIGTTSQAHSEVLCQRMDRIHFSCAVVGLPWKPNGVER